MDRKRLVNLDYEEFLSKRFASSSSSSSSSSSISSSSSEQYARQLKESGYVVIPVLDSERRKMYHSLFLEELREAPEFVQHPEGGLHERYVLGGFSAVGHPSSFHNRTVRDLRAEVMLVLVRKMWRQFVLDLPAPDTWNLEQIIDRMMFRPINASVTAESWHRDVAPKTSAAEEHTFGGWINLDGKNQIFTCAPATHNANPESKGFAVIPKAGHPKFERVKRSVTIPPGCALVFFEHLAHIVQPSKAKYPMTRLFLGWRLSRGTSDPLMKTVCDANPELDSFEEIMENKGTVPLKSGQIPPMYAKLHWTNWLSKIEAFSEIVRPEFRETRERKSKGTTHDIVQRNMVSLAKAGMDSKVPYYPDYELQYYYPNRSWEFKQPGTGEWKKTGDGYELIDTKWVTVSI